ncbi:multidrug resistance protein homolog 65-like [Episyrphus balteatus]|uniref:multidrug resistance protein homolog 65-like n=1 Tax=Episyrphus balteatus TaxID=286459 RepID=UPI002486C37D|nr:multidrug resistance protein homolog 65-like [Episyrphus balteatus]
MGSKDTKNDKNKNKSISYFQLFRYATSLDYFLIFIAFISCLVKALVYPAGIIVYSELVAMFVDRNLGFGTSSKTISLPLFGGGKILTNATKQENMAELRNDSWAFGYILTIISIVLFVSGVIFVDILNIVALRITSTMRRKFFEATLRKDIGWHDVASNQNFAVRITDNMEKIRDGISEKIGHFTNLGLGCIIVVVISFVYGWKLTLAISSYIPLVLCSNYIVAKYQSKLTIREQDSYVVAGSLVEEIIGAVRTVVAFGGEKLESERFDKLLLPAHKASKLKGVFTGTGDAITRSMLFFAVASAFYYGVILVLEDRGKTDPEYTPAVLMIAFFGILVGADHIARCSPFLDNFSSARGSALPIYEVIDSSTNIDPMSADGKILNYGLKGDIEFQDVFFRYPSREDVIVLRGLNLKVEAGQTVAFVGHSGCGKSTCIQLLQRFYDPVFGNVILDQLDIRKYNVAWLRSNIAVVGQEPVLFQGTIGENIRHGKPDASQKEIESAARAAGAHDFIIDLPFSYETSISEKGIQLSGGQKQRIAIARALIQNPKILLLDEATSALDYNSEKIVQKALNAASKGRTTIVVSHRLSAIKDADRIVFIHEGKAVEEGSHEDLMELRGKYYDMVTAHEYNDGDANEEDILEKDKNFDITFDQTSINFEKNQLNKHRFSNASTIARSIFSDDDLQEETQFWRTFTRLLKIARSEWCYLIFGTFCAILYGCIQPAYAYIFGEFYAALAETDPEKVISRTALLSIICACVGVVVAAICFIQTYIFNLAGIGLTTKLRSLTFKSILAQEIGWFDDEDNSVGILSARLSGDAASVQGAIGQPMSGMIQAVSNFVCCIALAFYFSWEMALACLCTSPFMVGSIVFEARYTASSAIHEKRTLEETSRIATEAIANIRTVAGLRREPQLIVEYNKDVEKYKALLKKRLRFRGIVNSSGMAILYFGYAVALTYGGILCSEGKIKYYNIIKVSESLLYGLLILATSLAFAPSFTTALISGHRLLRIVDRKPRIKSSRHSENNLKIDTSVNGVTYNDVSFRYPTRPDVQVLNGLNLGILQGKTVALVGASGCGKSTCIQLLLRYYDADKGQICIDGRDIEQDMALPTLRRRLGIVSQEPVLFEKTIAENIAYGDNYREVSMNEIIEAAKLANAHSFIVALPNGFETKLGAKGTQLSGGQKQRIAIARALVRNPQILLLDEATSALDLQSERIVQSALDTACKGRTCIVVAHRLTTIHNADLICVLQNGKIVEQGNHQQLLAKDGIYAKLYKSQPAIS